MLFMTRLGPVALSLFPGPGFVGISRPPFLVQEYFVMPGFAFAFIVKTLELFTSKLISFIASMNWGLSENESNNLKISAI